MNVRVKFLISILFLSLFVVYFAYMANDWLSSASAVVEKYKPKTLAEKETHLALNTYVNKIKSPSTIKLATPKNRVYFAVDVRDYSEAESLEILVQKNMAISNNYIYWGEKNSGFDDLLAAKLILEQQALLITWNPSQSVLEHSINQPKFRLKRILEGKFDDYLRSWTVSMKTWNRPIIIRFAPEMNGDWLPWGSLYTTPEEYKQTYRYVVDYFRKQNVRNVTWMWSPNEAVETNLLAYYPGDEYVDWVGISGFNWGNTKNARWRSLDEIYTKSLAQLKNINKPIALAELGCVEDKNDPTAKAKWITEGFKSLETKFPQVKMIVWNNGISFGRYDWRVNTSLQSLNAFKKAISSDYFSDKVGVDNQ